MNDIEDLSQAERAYRRLRAEILHGDLMPGERLRAADLQDRFQLGLTPIREALMRLSSESLVEAETNRGSRVTEASLGEFADLMATRRIIERACLSAAIRHGDAAWEAEIVAAMHLLSRTPLPADADDRSAAAQWEVQHRRFHGALVAACSSAWLLRFWNMLADNSERYRKVRLLHHRETRAEVRDVTSEHREIMAAVLDRDIERASALMDAHLAATEKSVARLLAVDANTPPETTQ
jgi:GntR family transcriptional regulator, carbon starvation induced regulator